MNSVEWTLQDRIYLAIVDLQATDARVRRIYKNKFSTDLMNYAASVEKNPNQTQVAQRIFAHAMADRLEGK